jgi:hypothetical protein
MPQVDTATEFQRRRRKAWRVASPWLTIGIIGCGAAFFFGAPEDAPWRERAPSIIVAMAFFALAGVGAFLGERIYRCPNCGNIPAGSSGVLLNPVTCPNCGVALK